MFLSTAVCVDVMGEATQFRDHGGGHSLTSFFCPCFPTEGGYCITMESEWWEGITITNPETGLHFHCREEESTIWTSMMIVSRVYLCFKPGFIPAHWCRPPKQEFLRLEAYNDTQIFSKDVQFKVFAIELR